MLSFASHLFHVDRHCIRIAVILLMALPVTATRADCQRVYKSVALSEIASTDSSIPYLRRVIETMGCRLDLDLASTSHQRRLRLLETGQIDILSEASWLPERETYAFFSSPYRNEKTLLVGLKHNAALNEVKNLYDIAKWKLTILAPDGGWFGPDVQHERERWRKENLMVVYKEPALALRDLRLHRAHVMLITDAQRQIYVRDSPDVFTLPFLVHEEAVYFMFSKKTITESEVHAFNHALTKLPTYSEFVP